MSPDVSSPAEARGRGAGEEAGWGAREQAWVRCGGRRGSGARAGGSGKGGALSMLLRAQRLALLCAGSVAPGTPLRILVLTRSDLLWLGSPDLLQPKALAPNLKRQV